MARQMETVCCSKTHGQVAPPPPPPLLLLLQLSTLDL
jgi:hypothetical protein